METKLLVVSTKVYTKIESYETYNVVNQCDLNNKINFFAKKKLKWDRLADLYWRFSYLFSFYEEPSAFLKEELVITLPVTNQEQC